MQNLYNTIKSYRNRHNKTLDTYTLYCNQTLLQGYNVDFLYTNMYHDLDKYKTGWSLETKLAYWDKTNTINYDTLQETYRALDLFLWNPSQPLSWYIIRTRLIVERANRLGRKLDILDYIINDIERTIVFTSHIQGYVPNNLVKFYNTIESLFFD